MRTTVDVDPDLLRRALGRFPAGTTRRTLFNEALRALVEGRTRDTGEVHFGVMDHIPVRTLPNFEDPIPGFPEEDD